MRPLRGPPYTLPLPVRGDPAHRHLQSKMSTNPKDDLIKSPEELGHSRDELTRLTQTFYLMLKKLRGSQADLRDQISEAQAQREVAALQRALAELSQSQGKTSHGQPGAGEAGDGRCEPPTVVDAPPVRSRSRSPSPVAEAES